MHVDTRLHNRKTIADVHSTLAFSSRTCRRYCRLYPCTLGGFWLVGETMILATHTKSRNILFCPFTAPAGILLILESFVLHCHHRQHGTCKLTFNIQCNVSRYGDAACGAVSSRIQKSPGSHGTLPVENAPRWNQCNQYWQNMVRSLICGSLICGRPLEKNTQ